MSELRPHVRAIAIAAAVSVGVVACVVVLTLLASGRPLSQFGLLVADVGAVTAALLLVCLAVLYLPLRAHLQRAASASRSSSIATGAVLGLATFVARTFILRAMAIRRVSRPMSGSSGRTPGSSRASCHSCWEAWHSYSP